MQERETIFSDKVQVLDWGTDGDKNPNSSFRGRAVVRSKKTNLTYSLPVDWIKPLPKRQDRERQDRYEF